MKIFFNGAMMTIHCIRAIRTGHEECIVQVSLRDWHFQPFGEDCEGLVEFVLECPNSSRPIDVLSGLYNKAQDFYDLSGMSVRMIDRLGEEI